MQLKRLYQEMETDRSSFLERAYRSAVFTIPALLPREGLGRDKLPQNYQSVGARGANNLSSKLLLTLFPPQLPFYRLSVDPFAARTIAAAAGEEAESAIAEIEQNLSLIEETGRVAFETQGWRPVMAEAMRHLVVTGNGLVFDDPDRGPQFVDLRRFVVQRDPEGHLQRVAVKQQIARQSVADLFDGQIPSDLEGYTQNSSLLPSSDPTKYFELFTGAARLDDDSFEFWQEVGGKEVPGSRRMYSAKRLPLIPLRFNHISGENYGSGYVEEYDGDLLALEMLSRSLTEGAIAAAKLLILVKPGASIRPQTITTAPNGAVRQGDREDVGTLQIEKQADFATAERRAVAIEQRLQLAFLMVTQRQAERVTAEEVRLTAQELEDALGGVYSSLADGVQKPIVEYMLEQLKRRSDLPKLPPGVRPVISTGLEAISRGHKASRLLQFGTISQQILGPEGAIMALRARSVLKELATSFNIDADTILKTEQEIEEERIAAQNQQVVSDLGPDAIRAASSAAQ